MTGEHATERTDMPFGRMRRLLTAIVVARIFSAENAREMQFGTRFSF